MLDIQPMSKSRRWLSGHDTRLKKSNVNEGKNKQRPTERHRVKKKDIRHGIWLPDKA